MPLGYLLPAIEHERDFLLTAAERREPRALAPPTATTPLRARPQHAERPARIGDALERGSPMLSTANASPTRCRVASLITALPGSASVCNRAATFTV